MSFPVQPKQIALEALVEDFFRRSAGDWHSERRYYTLLTGEIQEVVSFLTVRCLERGHPELIRLAQLHGFTDETVMSCGVLTTWESNYAGPGKKQLTGSTVFGILGETLYRDRGFATSNPITARFYFSDENTLRLKTEYGGSVFEEEIKLVGNQYRTRQTIISRAGEEQMIGQYLERRINR